MEKGCIEGERKGYEGNLRIKRSSMYVDEDLRLNGQKGKGTWGIQLSVKSMKSV